MRTTCGFMPRGARRRRRPISKAPTTTGPGSMKSARPYLRRGTRGTRRSRRGRPARVETRAHLARPCRPARCSSSRVRPGRDPAAAPRSPTRRSTGRRRPTGRRRADATNRNSLPSTASSIDEREVIRSAFLRSAPRGRLGKGILPARSPSIRSGTTSRITTVWPSSAEAGPADEAGVSGAEERDPCHRGEAYFFAVERPRPLAIAIIVSLETLSSSELTTQ